MMEVKVLAFAEARRGLGFSEIMVTCRPEDTPRSILKPWADRFAQLPPCRIAADQEFRDWDSPVGQISELIIIPPVSGG